MSGGKVLWVGGWAEGLRSGLYSGVEAVLPGAEVGKDPDQSDEGVDGHGDRRRGKGDGNGDEIEGEGDPVFAAGDGVVHRERQPAEAQTPLNG